MQEKLRILCCIKRKEQMKQMDVHSFSGKKVSFPSLSFLCLSNVFIANFKNRQMLA